MVRLHELRSLARRVYQEDHPSAVQLLCVWLQRDQPDRTLANLLRQMGCTTVEVLSVLEPLLEQVDEADKALISACVLNAKGGPANGLDLFLTVCQNPEHHIAKAMSGAGLDLSRLRHLIEEHTKGAEGGLAVHGINVDTRADVILQYGRDLTALASEGAFADLYDRPADVERLLDVLLRRQKPNAAVTGPAGVGKTALVELLAHKLVNDVEASEFQGARLLEVSMGKLVAGTRYRGDFEKRMDRMLTSLKDMPSTILFIDEMHLICGAGRAQGIITDAANLLKPFLARRHIRVIGATTVEEYHRYIARDAALARRFQEVRLNEPDAALQWRMVHQQAAALARHHEIQIRDLQVHETIELTDEHWPNRYQPDKSVELLDSAAVRVRRRGAKILCSADLLETLAAQTGRPLTALTGEHRKSLGGLKNVLRQRIIGQDPAIERVFATLIQRRQGIGSKTRNLGTFLFAGESGVGKTELGRVIADVFFGGPEPLLHLDLTEYSQPGSLNNLIGSPQGYRNDDQEGRLAAWLYHNGVGVLLFDEIEKAHPDVQRLLLGLLDNGRIRSARGDRLDSRQCVVILTTNAITPDALRKAGLGFVPDKAAPEPTDLLAEHFPDEFLGRFDEILLFNSLGPDELRRILRLRLNEAIADLESKHIRLKFEEDRLLAWLLKQLEGASAGARDIARVLEHWLLQHIALALLEVDESSGVDLVIDDAFYETGVVAHHRLRATV